LVVIEDACQKSWFEYGNKAISDQRSANSEQMTSESRKPKAES